MAAADAGHEIKVETQGSIGFENVLTAADIAAADAPDGGHQAEHLGQVSPGVRARGVDGDAAGVHLQHRQPYLIAEVDHHRCQPSVGLGGPDRAMQALGLQCTGHHDRRPFKPARERTPEVDGLGAQIGGGGKPGRIAVGVADFARSERPGADDGVKADRRCITADDQHVGAGSLPQSVADGAVGVDDVVKTGMVASATFVDPVGGRHEHVVGGRDEQQVGHPAAVATAGLAEPIWSSSFGGNSTSLRPPSSDMTTAAWWTQSWGEVFSADRPLEPELAQDFWKLLQRDADRRPLQRLLHFVPERRAHAQRWDDAIAYCPVPLHLIWGLADLVSGSDAGITPQRLPGARLVAMADIGHAPHLEDPPTTARHLLTTLG